MDQRGLPRALDRGQGIQRIRQASALTNAGLAQVPRQTQDSARVPRPRAVDRGGQSDRARNQRQDERRNPEEPRPLSVGTTIDEACYWFICFDRCYQSQLMIDAATPARGEPATIDEEVAREAADTIGTRSRGFLHFQPYYQNMIAQTGGAFLL
ncbi:hypothetical protein ANO14919_113750 [Xylariales sp. No.14919]|nr:hypothetical protein ANO14919_113750 [Xylariales sp. No.14919]